MIHPKYRPDIDGLRAIAVLIVVGFHAFPEWLHGGYIGVDVFFIISGFLISTIIFGNLKAGSFSFLDFYSRRIKRIFPALLVILVTLLILGWNFFIPEDYAKLGKHVFAGAAFVSNFVSLSEFGYFDDAAEFKPLLHLWSLGIEEQFYIVWPVILWFAWRLRISLPLMILTMVAGSFALNVYRSGFDTTFAFFSPLTRAWELLIGAGLGYVGYFQRDRLAVFNRIDKSLLSFTGLAMLLFGCLVLNRQSMFPGWWALLPTVGAALIIAAGPQSWLNRSCLAARPLVAIGLVSYPLYLWHWSLLSFFSVLENARPSLSSRALVVLASFVLAWLTYRLVETPVRKAKHTRLVTFLLCVLMACVASIGLYLYKASGVAGQTSQPLLKGTMAIEVCTTGFRENQLCIFGNRSAQETILVFGDSHAEHLTAALNETLGNRYKIIFAFYPSCFFGNDFHIGHATPPACAEQIEQIKALKGTKLSAVIRAQRWHGYGIENQNAISRAMDDAIQVFGLKPEKIILVGSTADIDIRCAKWNYYFPNSRSAKPCIDNFASRATNERFMSITKGLSVPDGVHFVYPYDKLCNKNGCKVIENNVLYYSDAHHLTKDGAMLIMPDIVKILQH